LTSSMTGYGKGRYKGDGLSLTAEVKTVNHRYLDISFRLPRELQSWEDFIRNKIKEKVFRGRVEISLHLEEIPEEAYYLTVNHGLVHAYGEALEKIRSQLSLHSPLSLEHILHFSDIFTIVNNLGEKEETSKVIEKSLEEALENLVEQRRKEGKNLKEDLETRGNRMQSHLEEIRGISPQVSEQYRLRLEKKLGELLGDGWDENRVIAECALLAEKSDIDEELTRAGGHLQVLQETLNSKESAGRKLDFLLQELLREINTIGAKANHYGVASLVVEAKAELEKMREQVQNLE